ncbi:MAG: DUF2461 domain-containing protein [Phycisphaerae bacterium]|nr:DUF2461 domain-containing protein [Tepidisphaeraceae bacterium]
MAFDGFTPKMVSFFRGLTKNNDRTWFGAHKGQFDEFVRGPMLEAVCAINDRLRKFAAEYVSDPPHKALYRIYRDTRFSKDKTPYKLHIAAHFQRRGIPKNAGAGYYFAVSHEGVEVGGGMYMPGPDELAAVRGAIAASPKAFDKIFNDRKTAKLAGPLLGDKLKRLPKGYEHLAGTPAEEAVKGKQWYWFTPLPVELAMSAKLAREVVKRFEATRAGVDWLNDAVLAATRSGEGEEGKVRRPEPMW